MHRDEAKAAHYISLLDIARCNGNWQEVPELVRKVTKHSSHRSCLITTAKTEYHITINSATLHAESPSSTIAQYITQLSLEIDKETNPAEDVFQARTCLSWAYFLRKDHNSAISRFHEDLLHDVKQFFTHFRGGLSNWTKICAIKAFYIRALSHEKLGDRAKSIETLSLALPFLTSELEPAPAPELDLWTERLLAHQCVNSTEVFLRAPETHNLSVALLALRSWARFWEDKRGLGLTNALSATESPFSTRRNVWNTYYSVLSKILQSDIPYPPPIPQYSLTSNALDSTTTIKSERLQQRSEMQRIQTIHETILFQHVSFPSADENNEQIEEWVSLVMKNWTVFCGTFWCNEDLGEGGKIAVSKDVLDILYRAASRSFHSTPILRHLFTVHLSLAEFELAFKAFDTYIEIVMKSISQQKKSGLSVPGMDNEGNIVQIAYQAICALCRYGSRREAEKARYIGSLVENLIKGPFSGLAPELDSPANEKSINNSPFTGFRASEKSLASAYRAIGMSQAHWSRYTYDAASRAGLQDKAIKNLRKSLIPGLVDSEQEQSLLALGLLLAEKRDLDGAIEVVKQALEPQNLVSGSIASNGANNSNFSKHVNQSLPSPGFSKERCMISLWHLLALLLTARQDFMTALKCCKSAVEQFVDLTNLFGSPSNAALESSHPKFAMENTLNVTSLGVVDDMEIFEKESLLQVKVTEVALIEVIEGSDAAISSSNDLLSLYARLFGNPSSDSNGEEVRTSPLPPRGSSGTLRNLGGALFGRPRTSKNVGSGSHDMKSSSRSPSVTRPQTISSETTVAPTIQITDEDSYTNKPQPNHHHLLFHLDGHYSGEKLHKKPRSLKTKRSFGSLRRKRGTAKSEGSSVVSLPGSAPELSVPQMPEDHSQNSLLANPMAEYSPTPSQVGLAVSPDTPLPAPTPDSTPQNLPVNNGTDRENPRLDAFSLSSSLNRKQLKASSYPIIRPQPQFPLEQERRWQISLLVDVWLVIAGLYRRAAINDDAVAAIDQASKLVQKLEAENARSSSNVRASDDTLWGGSKTVDELWGDIWAERGHLSQSQSLPYSALKNYEQALSYHPDHLSATVALCEILLDISSCTIPPPPPSATPSITTSPSTPSTPVDSDPTLSPLNLYQNPIVSTQLLSSSTGASPKPIGLTSRPPSLNIDAPTPLDKENSITLLATRARANYLLSSLTKLGSGWDDSEAWFTLARAHEDSGQLEMAMDGFRRCVDLEDTKPIRKWNSATRGVL
ncbi:MAG: hypothetical protein M1829_001726 [Trizodia sp. TS-e1964]|nr:MAG: hypothetical protein M1829_001726 [Trizodia sp. TS-e1964]